MIDKLVARVLATRNAAHKAHWAATGPGSYAEHMALGSFYVDIIEKLDEIVEVHQGAGKGLVRVSYTSPEVAADGIKEHIKSEASWIAANREAIADGIPSVLNLLDELHSIYARTSYKLAHLK